MSVLAENGKKKEEAAKRTGELQPAPRKDEAEKTLQQIKPRKALSSKPVKISKKSKEKKSAEQMMESGKKDKSSPLSLKESPQYKGVNELLQLLGPVFGNDMRPEYFVSRISTSAFEFDPVIEMKSYGPYYDSGLYFRNYGMVERLNELALTLQFWNDENGPAVEMPLRDLKASHHTKAGGGWVVTKADIDESAGTASIKIGRETKYGVIHVEEQIDAGTFKVRLVQISAAEGTEDTHPAIIDVLDANDQFVGRINVKPGETYTYTQAGTNNSIKIHVWKTAVGSTASANLAEISILSEEHTLTHGKRFDQVSSTDLFGKWFVHAGSGGMQKNKHIDYSNGIDFSSNTLSIYCEDIAEENHGEDRFKKDDIIKMPLGYALRCDGMVNDYKSRINISSEIGAITLDRGDGTPNGELQGPFIKLSFGIPIEVEDIYGRRGIVSDIYIYHPEKENGIVDLTRTRMYARVGNEYYSQLVIGGGIIYKENGLTALGITDEVYDQSNNINSIAFYETARSPDAYPNTGLSVVSMLKYTYNYYARDYRFKKETETSMIEYDGLTSPPTQNELPFFTTERGSQWYDISPDTATFLFNVGGNEPGIKDGIARFKWSVLDANKQIQFENPLEITDGKTKNGIYGRWRWPNYSIIPSPNNSKYADAYAEYHILSTKGTEFHFMEQEFTNKPDYFAYKVMPKTKWVVGESVVPLFGEEMLLTKKDDENKVWELTRIDNQNIYILDGKSNKIINSMTGQVASEFKAYIGDCDSVDKLGNPNSMTGADVLWIEKSLGTFIADAGPVNINPTSWLELNQQPRTLGVGFEIVKNKDFGRLGTMDAFKINLVGWEGVKSQMCITNQAGTIENSISLNGTHEIYYVITHDPSSQDLSSSKIIIKYDGSNEYKAFDVRPDQIVRFDKFHEDEKNNIYYITNQIQLSHTRDMNTDIRLILAEPLGILNEETMRVGYPLVAETEMVFSSSLHSSSQNGATYSLENLQGEGRCSLKTYHVSEQNPQQIKKTTVESHLVYLDNIKYNAKGTQIATYGSKIDFRLYDNDTYPTRWHVYENYAPYQIPEVEPIHEFDFTQGQSRIGIWGKIRKDDKQTSAIVTYENYSKIPSKNQDKYDKLGIKAFLEIYSPDGTIYDSENKTITNTPIMMSYHMSSENTLIPEVSQLPINGHMFLMLDRGVYDVQWLLENGIIKQEDIPTWWNGENVAAWVVGRQNPNNPDKYDAYLLMSGFPILKIDEKTWRPVPPDDPICLQDEFYQKSLKNNIIFLGEAGNMFDILENRIDTSKDAYWMFPIDLMRSGTTYSIGDVMDWGGGMSVKLEEKKRDLVKVEISQDVEAGHAFKITPIGYSGQGELTMGLLNLSTGNLEFETQPGDPVYIFGSGILDKDGNEIRGHPLLNKLVVIQNGKVVCSVIGGANIAIQEPIQPGDWSMIFQAESTMNYDPSTDAMISFSPSLNLLSSQIGKSQPIYFDGKTSDANPITYTNKGTLVESIGSAGNIQGLYFGMHTNYKQPELMPVFWDWHEPYFEYHEGKGLSSWSYLPSLSFIENVYPNPVERDGVLNIKVKMATPGRVHFEIYDIQGRAVIGGDTDYTGRQNRGEDKGTLLTSSEKILEIPIKPLGLSSGAYILRLHPDNSSEFFDAYAKFIVK